MEALRRLHLASLDAAALAVTGRVEGAEHLAGGAIRGLEHRPGLVLTPGVERRLPQQLPEPELLEQHEGELPEVRLVPVQPSRHRSTPESTGRGGSMWPTDFRVNRK